MKPVIVYKLVTKQNSGYESYFASGVRGMTRNYRVGKWTKALFGGLLCFRTLKDTCDECSSVPILRCEARGWRRLSKWRDIHCHLRLRAEQAWTGRLPREHRTEWPPGTVAFKEVKPLEVVK